MTETYALRETLSELVSDRRHDSEATSGNTIPFCVVYVDLSLTRQHQAPIQYSPQGESWIAKHRGVRRPAVQGLSLEHIAIRLADFYRAVLSSYAAMRRTATAEMGEWVAGSGQ